MIGLSLAESVRDIVNRKISERKVIKIISPTNVPDVETWEEVIIRYRHYFWKDNPKKCEDVFRSLLAEGKIYQPIAEGKKLPRRGGGWMKSEGHIEWNS